MELAVEAAEVEAAAEDGQTLRPLERERLRAGPSWSPVGWNRWGAVLTAAPAEYATAAAQQLAGEYQSLVVSHRIASNPRGGQLYRSGSLPCTPVARVAS